MFIGTRPGRDDKPNEDYVIAALSATSVRAVLLDGAGGPSELPTGCRHGTPWYVNQLGDSVMFRLRDPRTALTTALAQAVDDVARLHRVRCDLDDPGTPSSTVVMVRCANGLVEYLVLGDSTFVADVGGKVETISDRRIESVGANLWQEMAVLPTGTPEHQAARIRFVENQRRMRNKRAGGYPIASNDPGAAYEALTGSFPAGQVRRVALLSDGATRYVEFGLGTFADALDLLGSATPERLFEQVRAAEASDPAGERWPRAKHRDDIAAAYLAMRPDDA
ncbi:protein phosphatase 2C domain-containing protein [Nonomuraea rubra]